jgi:hypothetical protein
MEKLSQFRSSTIVYDIFGYLLPGFFFVSLIIIDFDFGHILKFYFTHNHSLKQISESDFTYKLSYLFNFLTWNTDSDFKFTTLLMLIMFCYLLGHVIAAVSSLVLEVWLNKKLLGFPSENLLDEGKRNWVQKKFKNYTKPFSSDFIKCFQEKFEGRFGKFKDRSSYYWLCFGEISQLNPVAFNRTMHFLSLYGFSRNVSACFFIYVFFRVSLHFCSHLSLNKFNLLILAIYFAIGFIMFKNYLKLFSRQCSELYYHFYVLHSDQKHTGKS